MRRADTGWVGAAVAMVGALAACELQEITVAEPEDVIIVESQVILSLGSLEPERVALIASTLLHRTFGEGDGTVPDATVRITGASGASVQLVEVDGLGECVIVDPDGVVPRGGSCYLALVTPSPFSPGEELALEVLTEDGRALSGAGRVPGSFDFVELDQREGQCRLEPDSNYRFAWTPSEGSWAYIGEANIERLDVALAPRGVEAPEFLYLNGLSIGEDDTDIVFPREFGIFDIFDLDRDLQLALQMGLPEGSRARVSISAVERNWVNWARGGNFNPSGAVRVPSVFGDGTGVFGAAVRRTVLVSSNSMETDGVPVCGAVAP